MGIRISLSIMMFLQFFIWGAWYVTAPNYLSTIGFGAEDFSWTYSVGPIAGMITPLLVGIIADRYFSAQKVLGCLHLLGGIVMYATTRLMLVDGPEPNEINMGFFGYMLTYYPTLALTNTVAMRNMNDPEKEFPIIRVFGTIGWIAAGLALSFIEFDKSIEMFNMAAGAAVMLGVFSFTLPNTPPNSDKAVSIRELLGLDALKLLKQWSYLVFMVSSILICIPLAFYYQIASRLVEMSGLPIGETMSYGQMSEIIFMLIMPLLFARLGVKWMLLVGMAAWVARYALFALGAADEVSWMIIGGIVLHGICYDFFFVTGQIYTDQKADESIRAQAQGLLVMLTLGLGMLIGAQFAGQVEKRYTTEKSVALKEQGEAMGEQITALEEQIKSASNDDEASLKADLKADLERLEDEKTQIRRGELRAIEWKPLWGTAAILAAVIMVLFAVLFHDRPAARTASDDAA